MQPRLVAISYPTSQNHEHRTNHSRSRSQIGTDANRHSRLSKGLRKFPSWQGLRSQISLPRFKQHGMYDEDRVDVMEPWSEIAMAGPGYRHSHFVLVGTSSKWQTLPEHIQTNILKHMDEGYNLHGSKGRRRRRRDLVSVQMTCRAWSKVAQRRLYETIQLKPDDDCDWRAPAPKLRQTRITKLRRTLRADPRIGSLVKHLVLLPESQHYERSNILYSDLIASVVMACPELETLTSFYVLYTHTFNRLFQALSSRSKLTKHTWVIGEDQLVQARAERRYSAGILSSQQSRMFLHFHSHWKNLETLNLVSHRGRGILEPKLLVDALHMLPSLKRLHVSTFDANDFSDETLMALPPLASLRLDRCSGVTGAGLCYWAQSPAAAGIRRLVLESQNITSLLIISELFEYLPSLEIFRLVQLEFEPGLPLELEVEQPLFASPTLKNLEWYTATGQDNNSDEFLFDKIPQELREKLRSWPRSKSSQHFLTSILDGSFPRLETIHLPGYGNLNSLLRWIRHTSTTRNAYRMPLKHGSVPTTSLRKSIVLKNNKARPSRLSLRPSSPTFAQYDQWSRPKSSHGHSVLPKEFRELRSPLRENFTISNEVPEKDSNEESLSDTESHSSGSSSTRSSRMSPRSRSLSNSSASTLRPRGRSEDGTDFAMDPARAGLKEIERNFGAPGHHDMDRMHPDSRHSSISLILNDYAGTEHNASAPVIVESH